MKNLKMLYIALIALLAGVFSACTSDWAPGEQPTGSQIAFLPSNETLMEFEESEGIDTRTILLSRANTNKMEDVYIFVETDKGCENFFKYDNIVTFEPGESTAEFVITVDHSKFEENKFYSMTLTIENPKQTPYGFGEWTVQFSLNPWRLIKVKNPDLDGSVAGDEENEDQYLKGRFRGLAAIEGLFGVIAPAEIGVKIYYHKDNQEGVSELYKVESPWIESFTYIFENATTEALMGSFEVANPAPGLVIDCTDHNNVIIKEQKFGLRDVYGVFGVTEDGLTIGDLIIAGKGGLFEDGVITFPERGIATIHELWSSIGITTDMLYGSEQAGNQSGLFRVILPGCEAADYTLAGTYKGMEVASDNKTISARFGFTYGDDVMGIKYLVVNGDVENKPQEWFTKLFTGEDENIQTIEDFAVGAGNVDIKLGGLNRGIYTIVAAAIKSDGVTLYERGAIAAPFYFAGIGDPENTACVFEAELGMVSKLAAQSMTPEELAEYPDYTSLAYRFKGENLKKISYFMSDSKSVADLLEKYNNSEAEVIANHGLDFDVDVVEMASTSTDGDDGYIGVFGGHTPGLDPETEYTFIVMARNVYGETATLTRSLHTAPAPPYGGDVVIGKYVMECENQAETGGTTISKNIFTLRNIPGKDNEFYVKDFAYADGREWYATYNKESNKLELSGKMRYWENAVEDGNMFAYAYGIYDATKGLTYAIQVYPGISDNEEPIGPASFTIDPTTRELNGLSQKSLVLVVYALGTTPQGLLARFTAEGTTVKLYVEEDNEEDNAGDDNTGDDNTGDDNTGSGDGNTDNPGAKSIAKSSVVQIPFSSVKISKELLSSSNVRSLACSKFGKMVVKSPYSVNPTFVERCASTGNKLRMGELKLSASPFN